MLCWVWLPYAVLPIFSREKKTKIWKTSGKNYVIVLLAHQIWKFMWAFLITFCQFIRLSINVSHYFSSSSTEPLDQLQSNLVQWFFFGWREYILFKMKDITPLEFIKKNVFACFSKILFSKPNMLKLERVWKHRQVVTIEV